jgi:hypothetical protein
MGTGEELEVERAKNGERHCESCDGNGGVSGEAEKGMGDWASGRMGKARAASECDLRESAMEQRLTATTPIPVARCSRTSFSDAFLHLRLLLLSTARLKHLSLQHTLLLHTFLRLDLSQPPVLCAWRIHVVLEPLRFIPERRRTRPDFGAHSCEPQNRPLAPADQTKGIYPVIQVSLKAKNNKPICRI